MGGICNEIECYPVKIGGHTDHVHILCMLSKKIALMKLVEKVKTGSSKWLKTRGRNFENFHWQNGYGAFSINPTQLKVVSDYIMNQEEHHKEITFQDEFRKFLKKYKVDYDERYVWD